MQGYKEQEAFDRFLEAVDKAREQQTPCSRSRMGKAFRAFLVAARLNPAMLERLTGMSDSTFEWWKSGRRVPLPDSVEKVREALVSIGTGSIDFDIVTRVVLDPRNEPLLQYVHDQRGGRHPVTVGELTWLFKMRHQNPTTVFTEGVIRELLGHH